VASPVELGASAPLIDPAADVEPGVAIGDGTIVGPRTRVSHGASVGGQVTIGRDVLVEPDVSIGDRATIEHGALLYRGVAVGDDVYVGPGAILTNDRYPRAVTSTGDVLREGERAIRPVQLERGASIGAGAVVVAGVTVGPWAMVGAGAVVTRDVPGHALVVGSPARRIGWVCQCGEPLLDSNGDRADAEPGRYATHQDLSCAGCGRVFVYVPDAESLEERSGPTQRRPATN
jgi:UDP-2-acetamido-3-amino-2,3-dideoxy-glucuronate N-acetyltransferase